ncbi:MAG TPA: outer membrane beta-barrel protein, partial [Bacteroidia bacterium]|nr:outer membrane beta-barrel protein [Bacteroidia bacterium]
MKRIRILFLLFALSTSGLIQAQQQPSGTIRLSVADSLSQPVDAAFVQLLRARDSSLVQTGLTEADGKLEFTALPLQTYFMVITHLGNRTLHTRPIELSESTMLADLGTLQLQTTMLKEVVVEAKTPFIEKLSDRLVVNVGSSSLNAGSNTLEVLQHSPGVKVDGNDNISLKGKQNVMVMIDGKTTMMSGTDLANYLRGLSAGSVDKIELITNPSAKYDASGNAGIINIRLKKDKRSGTNGSVSAGFGQGVFSRTAEGFNINHRTDKFNVFLSYNYSYRKALNDLTLYRQFYAGSAFNGAYSQHNYIVIPYSSHNVRTGLDFFLNDKTTLGLAVTGMSNRFSPYGQNTSAVIDSLQRSQSSFNTINHTQDNHYNVAINLNARHLIDTAGRELSADLDYAHYVNQSNQDFTTNYYALDNTLLRSPDILSGNLRGMLDIYSVKADYTHPLSKEAKLEAGIKSSYVKADNDLKYYSLQNNEMQYDTSKSNHFIYTENINAAYTNFSGNFNKTKVQAGLRIEQTIASGNQLSTGQKFTLDYAQLFPSLAFNRRITANQELGITLSRRIDRPTYGQLNPFRFYLDPSTIKEGNPYLLAQYTYG